MSAVRGERPTATSTFSACFFCGLPFGSVQLTSAPSLFFSIFVSLIARFTSMPRFLNSRSSSLEISSSSTGTTRGSISRIVTSAPKLLKIDANSTPTAPDPITTSDFGISAIFKIS